MNRSFRVILGDLAQKAGNHHHKFIRQAAKSDQPKTQPLSWKCSRIIVPGCGMAVAQAQRFAWNGRHAQSPWRRSQIRDPSGCRVACPDTWTVLWPANVPYDEVFRTWRHQPRLCSNRRRLRNWRKRYYQPSRQNRPVGHQSTACRFWMLNALKLFSLWKGQWGQAMQGRQPAILYTTTHWCSWVTRKKWPKKSSKPWKQLL